MKKNFSLLSGLFLISLMFFASVFTGNALADQYKSCNAVEVDKMEPLTDQEKFQPVVVALIQSDKHTDSFDTLLASIIQDKMPDKPMTALGKTAYLIKPYVPIDQDIVWVKTMDIKIPQSKSYRSPYS